MKIFISYRRSNDLVLARLLQFLLTRQGIDTFVDRDVIEVAKSSLRSEEKLSIIRATIYECDAFVALDTRSDGKVSTVSWLEYEVATAKRFEKPIFFIPILDLDKKELRSILHFSSILHDKTHDKGIVPIVHSDGLQSLLDFLRGLDSQNHLHESQVTTIPVLADANPTQTPGVTAASPKTKVTNKHIDSTKLVNPHSSPKSSNAFKNSNLKLKSLRLKLQKYESFYVIPFALTIATIILFLFISVPSFLLELLDISLVSTMSNSVIVAMISVFLSLLSLTIIELSVYIYKLRERYHFKKAQSIVQSQNYTFFKEVDIEVDRILSRKR